MRKTHTSLVLIALALLAIMLPRVAFAEQTVPVDITVGISHGGTAVIEAKEDAPKPSKTKLVLSDGEVGTFHVDFERAGDYAYSISQVPGTQQLTYDTTVYDMQVYITDNEGKLDAIVNVYNGNTGAKVNSRSSSGEWNIPGRASQVYFVNAEAPDKPGDSGNPEDPGDPSDPGPSNPSNPSGSGGNGSEVAVDSENATGNGTTTSPTGGNGTGGSTAGGSGSSAGSNAGNSGASGSSTSRSGSATSSSSSVPHTGNRDLERYLLIAIAASACLLALAVVYAVSTKRMAGR